MQGGRTDLACRCRDRATVGVLVGSFLPGATPHALPLAPQGGSVAQMLYKQMSQTHRAYSNYEVRSRG